MMRLTNPMLEAILAALSELIAQGEPQGYDEDEGERLIQQAHKAHAWVHHERRRRHARKTKRNQRAKATA